MVSRQWLVCVCVGSVCRAEDILIEQFMLFISTNIPAQAEIHARGYRILDVGHKFKAQFNLRSRIVASHVHNSKITTKSMCGVERNLTRDKRGMK